jgi:hypothetical protein
MTEPASAPEFPDNPSLQGNSPFFARLNYCGHQLLPSFQGLTIDFPLVGKQGIDTGLQGLICGFSGT